MRTKVQISPINPLEIFLRKRLSLLESETDEKQKGVLHPEDFKDWNVDQSIQLQCLGMTTDRLFFNSLWAPKSLQMVTAAMKLKDTYLLLGRKVMTNLDSIFKSRDITLPTKVRLVKAMVFPVVMYGCESWTVKKAERQRIDAFELWCWRRLLRVPWTARRSNQSILKEISPGIFLEGMMLKLKL